MRKALIVGIDYYQNIKSLQGCVNDAYNVKSVLERHSDGTINFGVNLLVATDANSLITRKYLISFICYFLPSSHHVVFY